MRPSDARSASVPEPALSIDDLRQLDVRRRARMARLLTLNAPAILLITEMKLVLHADAQLKLGRPASKWRVVAALARWAWHELRTSCGLRWAEWRHRHGLCAGPTKPVPGDVIGPSGCWICDFEVLDMVDTLAHHDCSCRDDDD